MLAIERQLGKLTTRLVAVGDAEATLAIRLGIVPRMRCSTVKNGILADNSANSLYSQEQRLLLRKSINIDPNQYVVASIGRMVDYKGILRFLQAAKHSTTDNTQFLFAGEGQLSSSAQQYINSHGLAHKTQLLGFIEHIDRVYAIADLIVLCSEAEACPYVILEAMRAKCPIIATSVIGIREHIKHNSTGILVSPRHADLALAIDGLLADRNKRQRISSRAYHHFKNNYLLETQMSRMCHLYHTSA